MLETELFAFLERTADAAFVVTEQGEICSWNKSAQRLFGYPKRCASPTTALATIIVRSTTSLSLPRSGRDSILGSWSNPLKNPGRSASVMPKSSQSCCRRQIQNKNWNQKTTTPSPSICSATRSRLIYSEIQFIL